MNKFVKTAAITGVVLGLGLTTIAPVTSMAASAIGTVAYQDNYKTIKDFNKTDLQKLTNVKVSVANVNTIYNVLKSQKTWVKAGFSSAEARQIANKTASYTKQIKGILTGIAKNKDTSLRVVYIATPYKTQVNFGTVGSNNNTDDTNVTPPPVQAKLAVQKLEVKIEYKKKDIEFKYEVKSNGSVKAKIENEFKGTKVEGIAAQKQIEAIFANFDISKKSQSQIVNQVISKLNLGKNYKEFEFEAKFNNKTKIEFEI